MSSSILNAAVTATKIAARQAAPTSSTGSARRQQQSSASTVLNTLWPVVLYALGFFILFLILRRFYPRIYVPRTFVASLDPRERIPALPKGFLNSFKQFLKTDDIQVLNTQGTLDGYLFLRLLKVAVLSCIVGCIIIFPILIPINATGAAHTKELNILTFSNVASPEDPNSYYRFYAHVICAYLFFGFIIYQITRESLFYISLRQAYLISPAYANRISSRTVLFLSIPDDYLKESALRELLGPDLVKRVWIPLHTDELEEKVQERDDMLMKLEGAEIDLIKKANAKRVKALKRGNLLDEDDATLEDDASGSVAGRWVKPDERPTHRIGRWGLWGKKVDTIDWCREHLPAKIEEVRKLQAKHRKFEGKGRHSAFVEFHTLRDAQAAYQVLTHHLPLHMDPRVTGMYPEEIIWYNLRVRWWERIIRYTISLALVAAVIILWTFPIAFVGTISRIKYLLNVPGLHWLSFITKLGRFTGLVTGLLPVILLAILMAILPIFLRLMARLGGDPTMSTVEYTVQNTYFAFYVIQGFLVTTLSSGFIQALSTIVGNPASIITLLATSLPESSNFYLSYFVLQGFGIVAQLLLSVTGLIFFYLFGALLDGTPRKRYRRWITLSFPSLGTTYPVYTTMFVIAISYSCIAPLVIGFATIGLTLFYLAYKYEFLYVYNVGYDTKGLMYARALQQLFVGLYLAQGCLIGLFAINLANSSKVLGPFILMIILIIFTALYHISLNTALQPTFKYLPKTLETEERRLLAEEDRDVEDAEADVVGLDESRENKSNDASTSESPVTSEEKGRPSNPKKKSGDGDKNKGNIFARFFRPDKYEDYHALRRLVPRGDFDFRDYPKDIEEEAYFHPSVVKEPALLWIPQDDAGVSRQEVQHTSEATAITDEGARLNEKGNIEWDHEDVQSIPIHETRWLY